MKSSPPKTEITCCIISFILIIANVLQNNLQLTFDVQAFNFSHVPSVVLRPLGLNYVSILVFLEAKNTLFNHHFKIKFLLNSKKYIV